MSSSTDAPATAPRREKMGAQDWGFGDEQLAAFPSVYRDDLFQGQAVLISGGGTGIGRAAAFLFARLGAQVMICGRREGPLADAAQSIEKRLGRIVHARAMTIRDPEQAAATVEEAWERMGRLDLLVNNAGGQFAQDAIDFSAKGWNAVIDTNLNGNWFMMQAAARQWRAHGTPGNVVNIVASVDRGLPQQAHSAASRAGIIHASKTVAVEWAPLKIRVNCIAPGTIATAGLENYPPDLLKRLGKANPQMAMGDVWDIVQGIVYLAGPTGKFITGETVHINGGSHLWGSSWPLGIPEYFKVD
jgi:NAD(P)-dependent dehydrogenase (short-subunit alcohol dehydrogenase family)